MRDGAYPFTSGSNLYSGRGSVSADGLTARACVLLSTAQCRILATASGGMSPRRATSRGTRGDADAEWEINDVAISRSGRATRIG
ncbi:MAG: hypothetical protein ACREXU_18090 [Gammaproteobacteria bacterium]